jgi:hypothetical protein
LRQVEITVKEIPLRRMAAQLLGERRESSPEQVVSRLGGIQAQDFGGAKWSVGVRLADPVGGLVERAIADGRILRTWGFRGTLHLIAADDVAWLLALLAPLVIGANQRRYRELELDEGIMSESNRLIDEALQRGTPPLPRSEIRVLMEQRGISTAGQRLYYLLQRAGLEGFLCLGPNQGRETAYAPIPGMADRSRKMDPSQAEMELARRYFTSHGPASVRDFCWWSGLPTAKARKAVRQASSLHPVSVGSEQMWAGTDEPASPEARGAESALFLPPFDEYLVGYRYRGAVLDPAFANRVNPGGGMLKPTVVVDGRVVGIWAQNRSRDRITIAVEPFRALRDTEVENLRRAARRYGGFHDCEAELLP